MPNVDYRYRVRYSLGIGLRIVGMWICRFLGVDTGFFYSDVKTLMMMMLKYCFVVVVVVRGMGCCSHAVVVGS